ncbi:MAG: ImmA/IrrE family metallo-endopeptidase [Bdellovibrionales bacterium]|nr:ImmA/IrrE family metallo-endopeptidase [Bdellovibrionales bacterium]
MNYLSVKPALLRWAQKRSGQNTQSLYKKIPKLKLWETGEAKPTLKQLEEFAKTVHTPMGYLLLDKPPVEKVPIPDFRRMPATDQKDPSPNLLDTLYICQRRQDWYKDYMHSMREQPLSFIGSVRPLTSNIMKTAENIRKILNFSIKERKELPTWTNALSRFIEQANSVGILVMVSGIVGNNSHRKLDPKEFRGFALSDPLAPLIFINGADTKAAQMFTIAHELAHLWINQTAVSNTQALTIPKHRIESWCNKVAAELLVPLNVISQLYDNRKIKHNFSNEIQRLARYFKVSSLVILRRIYDMNKLTAEDFSTRYEAELKKLKQKNKKSSGGDFFLTLGVRVGHRFAKALVSHTLEGHTSFRESFQLLGIKKMSTFEKTGKSVGVNMNGLFT